MIASTAPTVSCRSPIKPSIARRTKAATWSGNERASLPEMRVDVHRYRGALLSQGRQHARGNPVEETVGAAFLGHRHRGAHAPSGEVRPRPGLQPLQSDSRYALSGDEEAGRGRDVLRVSGPGDLVWRNGRDQGALAPAGLRQKLGRAAAPGSGPGDAARSSERLSHPAPRRVGGRADLSGDAVPEGRAAVGSGSARRAAAHLPERDVAEADVRRPAPPARAA